MVKILWMLVLSYFSAAALGKSPDRKEAPRITKQPSNTAAGRGGTAELMCEATGTLPLTFEWFHNEKSVPSISRRRITPLGSLFFYRVVHKRKRGQSDTGTYYCMVTNAYGSVKSRVVNLTIGVIRKSFRKNPSNKTVSLGSKVVLTCSPPRGWPRPKLQWLKNSQLVPVSGRIMLENKNQRLVIKNFQKSDGGEYRCEATNVAGRRLSDTAFVYQKVPPVFVERPMDKTVSVGIDSKVSFPCKASGNPAPKIIWTKDGNQTVLPNINGTLTLTKLKASYEGTYICLAQNSEGRELSRVYLTVNYPPEFIYVTPDVKVQEGTTLKLSCRVDSKPSSSTTWRHKETGKSFRVNKRDGNVRVDLDGQVVSLTISSVKISNQGTYTCKAVNSLGRKKQNVKVSVYNRSEQAPVITGGDPEITADVNSNITLFCDVEGRPDPVVRWFKVGQDTLGDGVTLKNYGNGSKQRYELIIGSIQGRDDGKFYCQAVNKISEAKKYTILKVTRKLHLTQQVGAGVPAMPSGVKIVEVKQRSVVLKWSPPPSDNSDPVLVYGVGYINVEERSREKYASLSVPTRVTRYTVKKLKPGTRYRFFVRGINKAGRGIPSLLSDVVKTKTRPSPTLESAKLNIVLYRAGPGELVVKWRKLTGTTIDGYYINWNVQNKKKIHKETLQNSQSSQYTINGLQESTRYDVNVQVFKNELEGPLSNLASNKTSNKNVILRMDAVKNDNNSIKVTWFPLWKKKSGPKKVKRYEVWFTEDNSAREKQNIVIDAEEERYFAMLGDLNPFVTYEIWLTASTTGNRQYKSKKMFVSLGSPSSSSDETPQIGSSETVEQKIKKFVLQPWFLGLSGGLLLLLIVALLVCCLCKRSPPKKGIDNSTLQLECRNQPESVRKPSEGLNIRTTNFNTENDALTPRNRGRESVSECESLEGRSARVYRCGDSPSTPLHRNMDMPEISITPNKYERMYRSLDSRGDENEMYYGRQPRKISDSDFDSPSRYKPRTRNPYTPIPKPSSVSGSEYDNTITRSPSHTANRNRSPSRNPYPGEAPPDYETAIAENPSSKDRNAADDRPITRKDKDASHLGRTPERYANPSSRQSSCSPGSEYSNQNSAIASRRKGLKPAPRLTIASVNWAEMLPPPPSHPPPSSVATRSPPPSPTGTSMCSETTYGRSHASSFLPRRSGSVVSADMQSDLEKATADSVLSGKSKGKSENKLPFDLAGITSDIIMQWADSVTNTSGSDNESPCSSPSRVSGISSDGSFLTDTDFANAVKAAAECGGFNIDIDLNMYKATDPISFQPFAGSLSTYNPETNGDGNKDSKSSTKKGASGFNNSEGVRDVSRSGRGRRARSAPDNPRDTSRLSNLREVANISSPREDGFKPTNSPAKEIASPFSSTPAEAKNNRTPRKSNEMNSNGSAAYVPALTRTSALGQLEPVNRGPVKKKYAVVKTLPQVQGEDGREYPCNYPTNSLSSSTSNASTIRSSSCPPVMLTDDDMEDDVL